MRSAATLVYHLPTMNTNASLKNYKEAARFATKVCFSPQNLYVVLNAAT